MFTERQAIVVPPELLVRLRAGISASFHGVNSADRDLLARDFVDDRKSHRRAEILQRYVAMKGTRLLEVGSGCGMNLVVWIRDYGVEAYGIEPGGLGFESLLRVSRDLLAANGLNPSRVQDAVGESLPYADASFDIVYSANVLEHTRDPRAVLEESVRVLKPGGTLHFEMPNFLSYFEGALSRAATTDTLERHADRMGEVRLSARSRLREEPAYRDQPRLVPQSRS